MGLVTNREIVQVVNRGNEARKGLFRSAAQLLAVPPFCVEM